MVSGVRLIRKQGRFVFVWLDSVGSGLPYAFHARAWRKHTYRPLRAS